MHGRGDSGQRWQSATIATLLVGDDAPLTYPSRYTQDPRGGRPIAAFRLEVVGEPLEGRWVCRLPKAGIRPGARLCPVAEVPAVRETRGPSAGLGDRREFPGSVGAGRVK